MSPMRHKDYPPDWPAIATAIKAAADWRCQDCGMQCYRPGERHIDRRRTMSVHHLGAPKDDGSPGDMHDKQDCRPENLLALCSACHLARDLPGHVLNAARTRRAKRIASGQQELPL